MSDSKSPTAYSAPGKVLLAGGYLVLDSNYSGLVIGLSARIHSVISSTGAEPGRITVKSPQFTESDWHYQVEEDGRINAFHPDPSQPRKNPFVETTLRYVYAYLTATSTSFKPTSTGLLITILADNDYYSQPSPDVPQFNHLGVPISKAHKTGLGSSAALVTSLTAALVAHLSPSPLDVTSGLGQSKIHNLAQAAHCAAQGKVGSGFDVAAAVFGSCVYHRFSPAILEQVGDAGVAGFNSRLAECVDKEWDFSVEKTGLPRGVRLLMGDVDCGSATPGMVKQVLGWRKEKAEEAKKLWDELESRNVKLIKGFEELSKLAKEDQQTYDFALEALAAGDISHASESGSKFSAAFDDITSYVASIRESVREMGEASGVAIEPAAQKRLLDAACDSVNGVLGGVVPGAGGYDAVAFLLVDNDQVIDNLKKFLSEWKFEGDADVQAGGTVKSLKTREEYAGVQKEEGVIPEQYL
ncbi:phosphomevalonate kinase [Ascobolus immersus RN42]|uniref:Phosphomevalonate kinase n=1 Tax=Ascobolus immersus RN42 TaxID=1160509 RepID=A0A3N4I927_ASCIM|nr:phosphomevalonate kinase [Ascobolus immersus RN42]